MHCIHPPADQGLMRVLDRRKLFILPTSRMGKETNLMLRMYS